MSQFTVANWIQIGLLVIGLVGGYFRFEARIQRAEEISDRINRRVDVMEDYLKRMDKEGTQFSRTGLPADVLRVEAISKRVQTQEEAAIKRDEALLRLTSSVTKIGTDLEWISGWVKVQSLQPKDQRK